MIAITPTSPPELIPAYNSLFDDTFTQDQRLEMMPMTNGKNDEAAMERLLLRVLAFAVINKASDVNISLKGRGERQIAVFNVNGRDGFTNFQYAGGGNPDHFKKKLFNLMNTPQGGSTSVTVRSRFEVRFPKQFAIDHDLTPWEFEPDYYVNFRVVYAKTFDGSSFTCRVLDDQSSPDLQELIKKASDLALVRKIIAQDSGLVLCVGPTGCGKTTLLNGMTNELNDGNTAISTIEDPVEYRIRGEGQIIQLEIDGEMTWQRALETFMRQHPDVIVVGEILNSEVAGLALQAAQTGHIVLATIHSEDSCSAPLRFVGMFRENERDWAAAMLSANLKLVLAPRLLPLYQGEVKKRPLRNMEKLWYVENGLMVTEEISETTASKRHGVFGILEALEITYDIVKLISKHAPYDEIFAAATRQLQFESLAMAAARNVEAGRVKLSDCRGSLPKSLAATTHRASRTLLAEKHGLSYGQVNELIDEYVIALDGDLEELDDSNIDDVVDTAVALRKEAA